MSGKALLSLLSLLLNPEQMQARRTAALQSRHFSLQAGFMITDPPDTNLVHICLAMWRPYLSNMYSNNSRAPRSRVSKASKLPSNYFEQRGQLFRAAAHMKHVSLHTVYHRVAYPLDL